MIRWPAALAPALLALACADPFDVDVEVSEAIPTVLTVRFDAELGEGEQGFVEFGADRELGRRVAATRADDGRLEALLVGNKPSAEVHWRAGVGGPGGDAVGPRHVTETGDLPGAFPGVDVEPADAAALGHGYLVTSIINNPPAAVILDRDGDVVWWHELDSEDQATTRALVSVDGRSVVYRRNVQDAHSLGLVRVSFDGATVEEIEAGEEHHDFVELPDGTLALLRKDIREVDGVTVIGDELVELDAAGDVTFVWTVWDHVEVTADVFQDPNWGFAHANAVDYDPRDDAYYVSARRLNTIFKIDRASGAVLWRLGGQRSDFATDDGEPPFEKQHQFEVLDDGLLVFDNGSVERQSSRALQLRLDETADTVEPVWSYASTPPLYCFALGDVTRLDGGETLVTFSTAGMIEVVTAAGEVDWRLNVALGGAVGYVSRVSGLAGSELVGD